MEIGQRITQLIQNNEITPNKLAKSTGVAQSAISKIVNGQTVNPGMDIIVRIADYFHVSTDYLIRGVEPDGGIQTHISRINATTVKQIGSGGVVHEAATYHASGSDEVTRLREEAAELRGQIAVYKELVERLMRERG